MDEIRSVDQLQANEPGASYGEAGASRGAGGVSAANQGQPADDYDQEGTNRKRQEQALMFEKYLEECGFGLSFQIILTEIIQKQIPQDQVFPYTAMRLRQIGKELEAIDNKAEGNQ